MSWRVIGDAVVGSSHIETGAPCQDRVGISTIQGPDRTELLLVVVCDGAGSAARAEEGAQLICDTLLAEAARSVSLSSDLDDIEDEQIRSWFMIAQAAVRERAAAADGLIRDYAATALLAVVGEVQALCAQVGDGGIVVRKSLDADFEVATWPESGEFVNETFFVTDTDVPTHVRIRRFDRLSDVIVFSDGLQRLALHAASQTPHAAFFAPLVSHVRSSASGIDDLERELATFLSSEAVTTRTDDDKSLVIGCRM